MATIKQLKIGNTTYDIKASQWATARSITLANNFQGSVSMDGTSNVTLNGQLYAAAVNSQNVSNYPWHRIAYANVGTGSYQDRSGVYLVRTTFNSNYFGIFKIDVRTNAANAATQVAARWLVRSGYALTDLKIAEWGVTGNDVYVDVFLKVGTYARTNVHQLVGDRIFTLVTSQEVQNTTASDKLTSYEVFKTVEDAATELHGKAYTQIVDSADNGIVGTAVSTTLATYANYIKDSGDARNLSFAYSKDGLAYGDYSWLAAWNGSELRAVAKSQFAQASHTHNYLPLTGGTLTGNLTLSNTGSVSATGNIYAGTDGDTSAERQIGVRSGAGTIYMYSQASATGSRGIYIPAHGTGAAKGVITINTNNDVTFTGSLSGHASSDLALSGGTVTGTLVLSKTTDASGTANNSPALIVGGTATSAHLELDANEIMAKTNGTSVGDLYLNNDGGAVYVGAAGMNNAGARVRNISYGTAAPSGGSTGEIYVQYS